MDRDREQLLAKAREWIKLHPESELRNKDLEKMDKDEIRSQLDSEEFSKSFSLGLNALNPSKGKQL